MICWVPPGLAGERLDRTSARARRRCSCAGWSAGPAREGGHRRGPQLGDAVGRRATGGRRQRAGAASADGRQAPRAAGGGGAR